MIDARRLWDFDDPAGSEVRFREAAEAASGADRAAWLTQVARAVGLQRRYDEGLALLDGLEATGAEVATRIHLERGRLLRSAGDPDAARPELEAAAAAALEAGLESLRIDALHMLALVADPADRLALSQAALEEARAATHPAARDWDASLLNNIGMVHADAGDHVAALVSFEEALEARQRIGDVSSTRVARWMVAWSLRNLRRTEEALALQRALKAELEAAGESDPFVDEEIALLTT